MEVTALGKKLFLSLFVRDFIVLYLRPEGSGTNSLWPGMSGIRSNVSGLLLEVFCKCRVQIWKWFPHNPVRCFNHPGQVLPVLRCAAGIPYIHTMTKDTLYGTPVKIYQQPRREVFFTRWEVLRAQVRSSVMWIPRNLMLSTRSTSIPCMSSGACAVLPDLMKSTMTFWF